MEHVSKSGSYLYAVIFNSNNKNFENSGGRIPKNLKGGARSLKFRGAEIPKGGWDH